MESQETPEQHLKSHDLTRQLEGIGITEEQLEGIRFRGNNRGWPFELWSYTFLETMPFQAISLVKPYAALKWLVLDAPPQCRDTEDAWRLITETLMTPNLAIAERARKAQSARAQKPRGKITSDGKTLAQITENLEAQHPADTAKELWLRLWSVFDGEGLGPTEIADAEGNCTYEYDFGHDRKRISFRRFQVIVSKARRKKKSR